MPGGTLEQSDSKSMLPPTCSIWNNWRGQAWCSHIQGETRDTEPWLGQGRDHAAMVLIARQWRIYLSNNDLADKECHVSGLLENF